MVKFVNDITNQQRVPLVDLHALAIYLGMSKSRRLDVYREIAKFPNNSTPSLACV